jgi:hypothetical protein
MIYFTKSPLKTWQPNLIQLDLEDDLGHIYVSRNTYDQSVIINDWFGGDIELVKKKVGGNPNQDDIIDYMQNVIPSPINILVPFYNLIGQEVLLNIDDIKQLVGVLSFISMSLDFKMMLKVPFEVRANLTYTKSILIDYQNHFDDFNFKIYDYERHIISERESNEREYYSEKDEDVVEEILDLDKFFDEIGWNDVKVPEIPYIEPIKEVSKDKTIIEHEQKSEADVYESIINKYV